MPAPQTTPPAAPDNAADNAAHNDARPATETPRVQGVPATNAFPATTKKKVAVVMGSDSDLPVLEGCLETLRDLGVPHEVRVISAHRTPERISEVAGPDLPFHVIIAAAGGAAHLAGALAARTTVPVIGVPLALPPLGGLDALFATVQMPRGIPVATVSVGRWGAVNAAFLAAEILALQDPALRERLRTFRARKSAQVAEKEKAIQERLRVLYGARGASSESGA